MKMARLIPSRRRFGIAQLPKPELRQQLNSDTERWLSSDHHITELPPGICRGLARYEHLGDIMIETGLNCEY